MIECTVQDVLWQGGLNWIDGECTVKVIDMDWTKLTWIYKFNFFLELDSNCEAPERLVDAKTMALPKHPFIEYLVFGACSICDWFLSGVEGKLGQLIIKVILIIVFGLNLLK